MDLSDDPVIALVFKGSAFKSPFPASHPYLCLSSNVDSLLNRGRFLLGVCMCLLCVHALGLAEHVSPTGALTAPPSRLLFLFSSSQPTL